MEYGGGRLDRRQGADPSDVTPLGDHHGARAEVAGDDAHDVATSGRRNCEQAVDAGKRDGFRPGVLRAGDPVHPGDVQLSVDEVGYHGGVAGNYGEAW